MDNTKHDFIDLFDQYFEVVPADTSERLLECYRLRYEVYCREGILPGNKVDDYSNGLEYDEYDKHSVQCLLIHKPKQIAIGTVRIILADPENPEKKLPLEAVAGDLLISDFLSLKSLRPHLGEISRLILIPEFRARKGENQRPYGVSDNFESLLQTNGQRRQSNTSWQSQDHHEEIPRRIFPHAIIGLFVAVMRMSVEHNLTYWVGTMEPIFARFLRSFGIDFKPITPILDYHGLRQGFIGYIPDIIENIYRVNSQLWSLLTGNGAIFKHPPK